MTKIKIDSSTKYALGNVFSFNIIFFILLYYFYFLYFKIKEGYSNSLRIELSLLKKNQKVILIEPSWTKTAILNSVGKKSKSSYPILEEKYFSSANSIHNDSSQYQSPSHVANEMVRAMLMQKPKARYLIEKVILFLIYFNLFLFFILFVYLFLFFINFYFLFIFY